jgi:hypothetical protein
MDRIKSWHATWTRELGLEASWHEQDKVMTFPSGARIVSAHLAYENEKYKYQGAKYQYPHGTGYAAVFTYYEQASRAGPRPTRSHADGNTNEGY